MRVKTDLLRWLAVPLAALMLAILPACEDDDDDDDIDEYPELQISPASVRVNSALTTNMVFLASGGRPGYTWRVSDGSLGFVIASEETAIYTTFLKAGQNFVTVSDVNSNSVTATVTQF